MNISQPIASCIGSVDFGFLFSEEIKALSVKQIHTSTTFDSLLHPNPGGLYDAALGAWADNPCSTCHLRSYACPGHAGHIELPLPVYHVTFMDQLLLLLRAQCFYCGHLKLRSIDVNRFICKLRLIQYGLLQQSQDLENIQLGIKPSTATKSKSSVIDEGLESEGSDEDEDSLVGRRNKIVERAIKHAINEAGKEKDEASLESQKVEAVAEERRAILKELLASAAKLNQCGRCKGASHQYRKYKYSKIFRKSLGKRNKMKMAQMNMKTLNPLVKAQGDRAVVQKWRREDREIDEGIVADLEDITSGESGEDIEMLAVGAETTSHDLPNGQSKPTRKKNGPEDEGLDQYINAQEAHASISELFEKEKEIFDLIYNSRTSKPINSITADMFFIKHILVPPTKFRPETRVGDGEINEAPQNSPYRDIIMQCEVMNQTKIEMRDSSPETTNRQRDYADLLNAWVRLQDQVNSLIDSSKNPIQSTGGRQIEDGIKQKLEKKEGLFRKNMMGKRVNFAARSVISPDPNIETNEIGVPPVFAKKLTYPEPVTNHNFYELKEAVLNGVAKWPGAAAIENENGQVINLRTKTPEDRQALANQLLAPSSTSVTGARNKKVHRHLNNGDIVLMNRQPTLHKPSMMAHRVRVLQGEKTIRMHYANCNTYNADFDGDEMNMHFPQNEIARAEALQIADTDHQYLVATSGKPLRGLIQDHISMGVWLTNRDTFFDREDYNQLLYACLRPENNHTTSSRILTVGPAVLKPALMWTGKQVITSVLKNITPETHPGLTLRGKSQTTSDRWGENSEEDIVIIQSGELLCGILDKAHLGPTSGGFVHSIYEAHGHKIAGRLLSVLGRLLTRLLHMRGFSCGMDDLLLTQHGDFERREKLKEAENIGLEVAAKYVTLENNTDTADKELLQRLQEVLRDDEKQSGLDSVYNSRTATLSTEITKACLPIGLRKPFPQNQMQTMTTSGAKGSLVNANLISCNLGQQVLEGRRVPVMVSGKTLPSFKPFETNVRAGGYITDRFLTGVKPQEYYFHAMAGREGLIDTAVKTSRSGYLQRCLIKGMEGLKVEYDSSVRDSDGTMVQFLYGEDGLDVTKQKHLKDFKFLADNYLSLLAQLNIREEFYKITDNGASAYQKDVIRKLRKGRQIHTIDPVLAIFNPGSNMGSVSESFAMAVKDYCGKNPDKLLIDRKKSPDAVVTKKTFTSILDMKYMKSVVDPGEAVGIIAGQSVGEPSTQMTLNTFHLAGHSARNVTMGIPRLREIIMTASQNISTPSMTINLIPEMSEEASEKFAKGITKITLAEVIDYVEVVERIEQRNAQERAKIYDVRLILFPSVEYEETYAIKADDIPGAIERKFIPGLITAIKKEFTRQENAELSNSAARPSIGESSGITQEAPSRTQAIHEGGDEDDDDEENDATNTKQKRNRDEAISYAAPDEDEEKIARQARDKLTPDMDEDEDEGFYGSPREKHKEMNGNDSDDSDQNDSDADRVGIDLDETRLERIRDQAGYTEIIKFSFDNDGGEWCKIRLQFEASAPKLIMLNLVEKACRGATIQSIPGLSTCIFTQEKSRDPRTGAAVKTPVVLTQGVNLRAMHNYQAVIDPHRLFTNDIHAMRRVYGIEAARATAVREMDAVFKSHSIDVNARHLGLIADVMTRGGGLAPFSRTGIRASTSPFAKMSFETTVDFLREAILDGDWDDLKGPSARIVMGKVSGVGTGAFDVFMPVT